MSGLFRTGQSIMLVAAAWNVLDALLHVAIGEVDPLRMAGNAVVLVATGLTYVVNPGMPRAIMAAGAAVIVAALNLAFFVDRGEVPVAAFVLVAVSLVLLGLSSWRFRSGEPEPAAT